MPKIRIIIQSRLSSSRLPAKALLPVAGIPLVVLCALRAGNKNGEVLVATSEDLTDDLLVKSLSSAGIRFIRGPLDNVLERFILASADLPDDSIIVRLTADNLFPDGEFAQEIAGALSQKGLQYLGTNSPMDYLPYGLSAEAFTVKVLREAARRAESAYDQEHVTPWIRRQYERELFRPSGITGDWSHLRCTVDTFDDYIRINKVFDEVNDPVNESWVTMCEILSKIPGEPDFKVPYRIKNGKIHSALTLGTVQLGMKYGIANRTGQPSQEEATNLIHQAVKFGVTGIDTARGYGESESRIGDALSGNYRGQVRITTKLDPLIDLKSDDPEILIRNAVDASIFRSCRELKIRQLPMVLLHRWVHRHDYREIIWRRLLELKAEGIIKGLGASVQNPAEGLAALEDPDVEQIQLPFNLLDWRWKAAGFDEAVLKRKEVIIHARSALLQGILISEAGIWPQAKNVDPILWVAKIEMLIKQLKRKNRQDLCLAYVRAQPWIDSVVVGMESLQQLDENLALFRNPPLTTDEVRLVEQTLSGAPEELLNPAQWGTSK